MNAVARRRHADVLVGDSLGERTLEVDREQLVRYAGASLDFNPIHWNDRAARSSGLPDVIAHGMLTMALGGRLVTDWAGDPGAVREFAVRFAAPIAVPAEGSARISVSGTVTDKLPGDMVAVELRVSAGDRDVLTAARATVALTSAKI